MLWISWFYSNTSYNLKSKPDEHTGMKQLFFSQTASLERIRLGMGKFG